MNFNWFDSILTIFSVCLMVILYRFGKFMNNLDVQQTAKNQQLQKAFYAANQNDVDKIVNILGLLEQRWTQLTEEEQINARRAKLHLEGALEFQKLEFLHQSGELVFMAGKRLTADYLNKDPAHP